MDKGLPEPHEKWLVSIRRDLHKHPELAYQEKRTSAKVARILSDLGCRVRQGIAKTGVMAVVGDPDKPCLGFRADMDALPIQQSHSPLNERYRSTKRGVMHACGHDAHTAIMLGVARVLAEHDSLLEASGICAKFLFQPAEEGGAGAKRMIDEGALEDPMPRVMVACHMVSELEVGRAGLSESLSHASADVFHIRITGRGGHGAHPDQCRDPIVAASHLVSQFQTIVSRRIDPLDSAVVSVGRIAGGTASNVIPSGVELDGTIRAFTEETRTLIWDRIQAAAKACELCFDLKCSVEREEGYPPCRNDVEVARFLKEISSSVLGEDKVEVLGPSMGAEDFAYYASVVPSAMLRLGCTNRPKGICWDKERDSLIGLHSPHFDIDERVLGLGVKIFTQVVTNVNRLRHFQVYP